MYQQEELHTLLTDATITSLLDDPSYVWNDTVVPDLGVQVKTINYFRVGPVGPEDYTIVPYYVNCRAPSQKEAEAIARAVRDVVNRHSSGSGSFVASILRVVPPADSTDNYNAPVEVTAKGRNV